MWLGLDHYHIGEGRIGRIAVDEILRRSEEAIGTKVIYDFYMISLKDKSCGVDYGRNTLDFNEGVMAFSAPGQVYTTKKSITKGEIEFDNDFFNRVASFH